MATSGNFLTSDSGQGGGNYYGRMIFEWWRTAWGYSGSVGYHTINYSLKTYGGATNYWQYFYQGSMNVDGAGYSWGTTQAYGGGATKFGNYGKTLYTNGSGARSFSASAQGGIYYNTINTSGSGSWALDTIPMYATISSTSGHINDDSATVKINYSDPTGGANTAYMYVRAGSSGGWTLVASRGSYSSGANFNLSTAERNTARGVLANTTSGQVLYRIYNGVGNTDSTANFNIVSANPTFTTATYKDKNSTTSTITGDDQYMIQGKSVLEATILSGDKAVALKSSSMDEYNFKIGSIDTDVAYSTSDIVSDLGTLGINSDANLVVKAIDSRNLSTSVSLPVSVLPYLAPQVTATAQRVNNFETETDIHIEGVISRLTISSVDKNDVSNTDGVQYRYKKTSDGSFGSWTNVASTLSSGNVSTTDFELSLDRNFAWNIEVKITDELETSTVALVVPVGEPIFRIGLDGKIYNNEKTVYPCPWKVGDILISTDGTNPSDRFEGTTWVAWGEGKVIGGYDASDSSFDTAESTLGNETHSHNADYAGARVYNVGNYVRANRKTNNSTLNLNHRQTTTGATFNDYNTTGGTTITGNTRTSSSFQPTIVAYFWKRTT